MRGYDYAWIYIGGFITFGGFSTWTIFSGIFLLLCMFYCCSYSLYKGEMMRRKTRIEILFKTMSFKLNFEFVSKLSSLVALSMLLSNKFRGDWVGLSFGLKPQNIELVLVFEFYHCLRVIWSTFVIVLILSSLNHHLILCRVFLNLHHLVPKIWGRICEEKSGFGEKRKLLEFEHFFY